MIADPIAALIALLKDDADVTTEVGTRVFGGELPPEETESMPRSAIVVKPAGGGFLGSAYQQWGDTRADVVFYGSTPKDAWDVYRAAHPVLKQLGRSHWAGCLLHWAKLSGGPVSMRDADTDWPVVFTSWQVLASEVAV